MVRGDRIVNTGHRCSERAWRRFMLLCAAYGVRGNQGLNRLVDKALDEWVLPGFKPKSKPEK